MPADLSKPNCYRAFEGLKIEGRGYIPAIVVEDDPDGYYPMGDPNWDGTDPMAQTPYFWGQTLAEAQEACDRSNLQRGIDREEAERIYQSTLRARRIKQASEGLQVGQGLAAADGDRRAAGLSS